MEKFVAVVFDTEKAAFAGAEALRTLHRNGDLTVYAAAVVAKDQTGQVSVRKSFDEGPVGTFFGLGLGALVGLLAGPAAVASGAAAAGTAAAAQVALGGSLAGAVSGGAVGSFRDLDVAAVDTSVLAEVSQKLETGKSCLVASISETWTAPLDARMSEAGGTVIRKPRFVVEDDYAAAEAQALEEELAALKEGLRTAHQENKQDIRDAIDATKARLKAHKDSVSAHVEQMQQDLDARIAALDEQIASSAAAAHKNLAEEKARIAAEHQARKARLEDRIKVADAVLAA